jgi:hypothetical protein
MTLEYTKSKKQQIIEKRKMFERREDMPERFRNVPDIVLAGEYFETQTGIADDFCGEDRELKGRM